MKPGKGTSGLANRYPIVPGTASKSPKNAAVPTAEWIAPPVMVIAGTDKVPPPIPMIEETPPIIAASRLPGNPVGTFSARRR